jgi:DNA-binding SARP family transcriptional activator/tetratricopeptide (TPR) repeat protein
VNSQLEFGLLGPLDIRVAGRPVLVRSPKYRILLAALLVEPGRLVPTAELVEAIWGLDKPDSPRRALQLYVTRVRTMLLDAGAPPLIGTGADGYRADVPPGSVDVTRFHQWLAQAGAAADRSDPAAERAALATATGLWRGEPLADVPSDYLHREYGHQLTEQRLRALERRIDLSLHEGRHVEAVDELVRLTAQHPLREKLWIQLITALDRGGRRADALNTYHLMRRQLADELGIEPGAELRELHAKVLGTDARTEADRPAFAAVPRQIPCEVVGFAGRTAEIGRMDALLDAHEAAGNRSTILVLTGMAGVGKTALAGHWCRQVADRFPDGQLWVDLRGYHRRAAVTPEQALAYVLRAVGVEADMPAELDSRVGLYRSVMDGRRMLVVLDNASSVDQVRPLLPGGPGSLVLVTSRNDLSGLVAVEGAQTVRLEPFTAPEARHMLAPRLGGQRIDAEADAVDRIVAKCGGLPLALAIVAARAVARPGFALAALDQQLADAGDRLDQLAIPDGGIDVRAVFSWSYRTLSPEAARLFSHLGLHAGPDVTAAAAAALAGTSTRQARLLLGELARANLVAEHKLGRYTVHDLLRAYAVELAAERHDERERTAVTTRILGFYLATVWRTLALLCPGDQRRLSRAEQRWRTDGLALADEAAALEWLDAERDNLMAAVQQAVSTPGVPAAIAVQLAHALFGFFSIRAHWDDWAHVNQVALDTARRLGDRAGEAHAATDLAFVWWLRGRFGEANALYEQGLAITRELGDRHGEAAALAGLGDVHRVLGSGAEAIARYEESLAICRELNDLHGQTMSLGSLGLLYHRRGRSGEALACLRDSLAIREKLGDRRGQATSLSNLGAFYRAEGRYDEALSCYEQSLAVRREQGDRHGQGTSLGGLGAIYQQTRHPVQALAYQQESVAIFRELADAQCLAESLRALGSTLDVLGRAGEAEEHRREAAEIFERLGNSGADPAAPTA